MDVMTYTDVRNNLKRVMDSVVDDFFRGHHYPARRRAGRDDVARKLELDE